METDHSRRILIVAHKSVATPALVEEVRSHAHETAAELALLIPDADDPAVAAWTLRRARRLFSDAVGLPVEGIVAEGDDAYAGIVAALDAKPYDEVVISTLPESESAWLRDHLPERVEALGVRVRVVTAAAAVP